MPIEDRQTPLTDKEKITLNLIKKNGDIIGITVGPRRWKLSWANKEIKDSCPAWKDVRGLTIKNYIFTMPFSTLGLIGTGLFVTDFSRTCIDVWNYHPRYIKYLRENGRSKELCDGFLREIVEEHGIEWSNQIDSMEYKG